MRNFYFYMASEKLMSDDVRRTVMKITYFWTHLIHYAYTRVNKSLFDLILPCHNHIGKKIIVVIFFCELFNLHLFIYRIFY